VIKKQPKVIGVLLDLGADIEGTNIEDLTPLDQAALCGEAECARILLDRGARLTVAAAFALQRRDAIERILAEDPDILKPGHRLAGLINFAASHSSAEVIESLIAHGASVDVRVDSKAFGTRSYTPLHSAAWTGNLPVISVLIKHGASLDVEDATYKATPLGWAKYAGRAQAAELLRAHGAK